MVDIEPSEGPLNGAGTPLAVVSSEAVGSKRQRRPSVRLGDIGGDQPSDSHNRRISSSSAAAASKQWRHQSQLSLNPSAATASAKSSKTRALTNLSIDFNSNNESLHNEREANNNNSNLDGITIGSWRVKDFKKRGPAAKRVRSNWVSKFDDSSGGNVNINGNNNNTNNNNVEAEDKYSGGEDNDDFGLENSESPMKDHSPIHCLDNLRVDGNEREVLYHGNNQRRPIWTRVSDGLELSGPSDADMRRCEEDGIRIWLNSLGLGRYAPVFKIHEVDDEILPLLTLEDLKDMGINAVGSRRKLFCAIQKLGKNRADIFEAYVEDGNKDLYADRKLSLHLHLGEDSVKTSSWQWLGLVKKLPAGDGEWSRFELGQNNQPCAHQNRERPGIKISRVLKKFLVVISLPGMKFLLVMLVHSMKFAVNM